MRSHGGSEVRWGYEEGTGMNSPSGRTLQLEASNEEKSELPQVCSSWDSGTISLEQEGKQSWNHCEPQAPVPKASKPREWPRLLRRYAPYHKELFPEGSLHGSPTVCNPVLSSLPPLWPMPKYMEHACFPLPALSSVLHWNDSAPALMCKHCCCVDV